MILIQGISKSGFKEWASTDSANVKVQKRVRYSSVLRDKQQYLDYTFWETTGSDGALHRVFELRPSPTFEILNRQEDVLIKPNKVSTGIIGSKASADMRPSHKL